MPPSPTSGSLSLPPAPAPPAGGERPHSGLRGQAVPATGRLSILPRPCLPPILGEIRTVLTAASTFSTPPGSAVPGSGEGKPVLLIPGLHAGDYSLHRVRDYLRDCDHEVWSSGIVCNVRCSEATVSRLVTRLAEIADRTGRQVTLVGHSRGGLFARVLSRRRPDLVSGAVTLGSPVRDQLAVHPAVWAHLMAIGFLGNLGVPRLLRYGCALSDCCADFRRDLAAPVDPKVSYLSVYSRRDGIVDWRACLDPIRRNLEVSATHFGMILDRTALSEIAAAIRSFGEPAAAPRRATGPARLVSTDVAHGGVRLPALSAGLVL
jgi:triacylglycerol lipase